MGSIVDQYRGGGVSLTKIVNYILNAMPEEELFLLTDKPSRIIRAYPPEIAGPIMDAVAMRLFMGTSFG